MRAAYFYFCWSLPARINSSHFHLNRCTFTGTSRAPSPARSPIPVVPGVIIPSRLSSVWLQRHPRHAGRKWSRAQPRQAGGRWIAACNICTLKIRGEGQPFIDPCALMGRRRSLWPPTATRWGDAAALQPRAEVPLPGTQSWLRSAQDRQQPRCSHGRDSLGEVWMDAEPTVAFPESLEGREETRGFCSSWTRWVWDQAAASQWKNRSMF